MDKDGIIGRPHTSEYENGAIHQDWWHDGQHDQFLPKDPLGAFAIGGAIEAERRAAKRQ